MGATNRISRSRFWKFAVNPVALESRRGVANAAIERPGFSE